MVGGTTPSRVIQVRFPESCPQPSLAKQAVLTHRPGYFCLDNAFALIEGPPCWQITTIPKTSTLRSNPARNARHTSKALDRICFGFLQQDDLGGTQAAVAVPA